MPKGRPKKATERNCPETAPLPHEPVPRSKESDHNATVRSSRRIENPHRSQTADSTRRQGSDEKTAAGRRSVEFNKANVEALVAAGKIAAKGIETLGQEGVTYARKSFEDTTAALKGYTAVKTPADFFKLYAENSKKAFDAAVAQTSKTSELVVKLTNESFAPISNRVSVITSKMKAA